MVGEGLPAVIPVRVAGADRINFDKRAGTLPNWPHSRPKVGFPLARVSRKVNNRNFALIIEVLTGSLLAQF